MEVNQIVCSILLLVLASIAEAQGPTPSPQSNQCYSTTSEYQQARITSQAASTTPLLIRQMFSGPQVEVHCLDVKADSPYGKSLIACTQSVVDVLVCWSTLDGNYTAAVANRTGCTLIVLDVLPQYIGDVNGPEFFWAFFIDLRATPAYCFPRTVDVAMLAIPVFPSRGSTLLLIVLVIVLVFLVLCGLAFGGPRLKQHVLKILRRGEEEALDLRPPPDPNKRVPSPYEPAPPGPTLPVADGELDTSRYASRREMDEPASLEMFRGPSLYDLSLRGEGPSLIFPAVPSFERGHDMSSSNRGAGTGGMDMGGGLGQLDRSRLASYSVIPQEMLSRRTDDNRL